MNFDRRSVISVAVFLITVMLPLCATAQQNPSIVGTWELLSLYDEKAGNEVEVFGQNPQGRLTLDKAGFFSLVIVTSTPLTSPRENRRTAPITHEMAGPGTLAYYGSYAVDDRKRIHFHIENGLTGGWKDSVREAQFDLAVDKMTFVSSFSSLTGSDYSHLIWRRLCE